MNKYKAGDKVVLEILSTDCDGYYKLGSEHYSWWENPKYLDEVVEPLSTYTEPLEAKIRRQAAEITRLLAENAELKGLNSTICDVCKNDEFIKETAEQARAEGQQEAWKLARKCMLMTDREREAIFGSGHNALYGVLTYFDYKHAAAKVAEWERAKEEIHVGDIVRIHEGNDNDLCIICSSSDGYYNAVDEYGAVYPTLYKKMISKTGRHIDVDAWLAQIGGEE